MPLYRVELVRIKAHAGAVPRNPFEARIDVVKPIPCTATYRAWEFEARSERVARRLLKEAQDAKLPNVVGFTLHSIREITEPTPEGEEPKYKAPTENSLSDGPEA